MSENIQHIDVDDDDYLDAPKALRDHVKKLQEALDRVSQERDTFRDKSVASSLSGVLSGFKNPERVKRDLLGDKVDPLDSEAVNKWLADNGDDYARGTASEVSDADRDDPEPQAQVSDDEREYQRQANADLRKPADMSKIERVKSEITPAMSGAEIKELYRKHGL